MKTSSAPRSALVSATLLVLGHAACGDDTSGSGGSTATGASSAATTAEGASSGATGSTVAGSGSAGDTGAGGDGGGAGEVSIEGDVLAFLTEVEGPRVAGATVTILEHPEMSVVAGDDAHFRFDGLHAGEDVTLVVEHEDFKTTQTATVTLGPKGVHPFAVQILSNALFDVLSGLVPLPVEEDSHCVIASTAARFGGSLYVHLRQGLPDVEVALDPAPPEESGPIYFNEAVLPDPEQPTTSIDGGVFFYRVPPGEYVMSAERDGYVFNTVRFDCRAGIVVNAGPANGLQAHVALPDYGAGVDRPADDDSDATDAMCVATAACVNDAGEAGDYPDAMLDSCKAMFRYVWASVDADCDEDRLIRDAARAVYDCRTAGPCDVTLGQDDACADEEVAFREAEATYGACVANGS